MTTPAQGFRRRVREKSIEGPQTLSFFLETTDVDENGEEYVVRHDDFLATRPTEERLFLFIGGATGDGVEELGTEAGSILALLRDVLPADQYRVLIARLRDPDDEVDIDMLSDVIQFLVERWADFSTRKPSGSSPSQAKPGGRSTGRSPGAGSIPSNSR